VFWDGPVLIPMARTGVRTCRCALGRPLSSVLRWWSP
jgi:hypothetical protein